MAEGEGKLRNPWPLLQNSLRRASSSESILAEGEGFEPSLQVAPDYLVSNETPSTTWVTLRINILYHTFWFYDIIWV